MFGCRKQQCRLRRRFGSTQARPGGSAPGEQSGADRASITPDASSVGEVAAEFRLSTGESLAGASETRMLTLVFLRHFGCTFTRQLLRGLEDVEREARARGSELVLVHMLKSGEEVRYLSGHDRIARIADPKCRLYRAFGLGRGGFLELFGPRVWWLGAIAIFKGCGVGHLAGDGMQMPGAFVFHRGRIIAAQRAASASDLPDLPSLFRAVPSAGNV